MTTGYSWLNENADIFVYGLVDPITKNVRYVGRSLRPRARLSVHSTSFAQPGVKDWIESLRSQNTRPILVVLKVCTPSTWQAAERAWIAYFRTRQPGQLLNTQDGGHCKPTGAARGQFKRGEDSRRKQDRHQAFAAARKIAHGP